MKKKRILLNTIKLNPVIEINPNPSEGTDPISATGIELRLNGEYVAGFAPTTAAIVTDDNGRQHSSISGFPERTISINIPEEDMPRVKGWFSNDYQGVAAPESDTLVKNLKTAVSTLLNDYDLAAQNHNQFRMPCKFAWCAVDNSEKRTPLREIPIEHPNRNAPFLPILNHYFLDNQLFTRVQIRNIPSRLSYKIGAADLIALRNAGYVYIELFATKEGEYRPMKSSISGISTVNIESNPSRCWIYDRFSSDEIENSVRLDTDYRRLCRLTISELSPTGEFINLPISSALLANFKGAVKYKDDASENSTLDKDNEQLLINNSEEAYWTHFISDPLDLGLPEDDKHLHSVTLYGIFERMNPAGINLKVFGSHHREHWHLVAATRSPIIHGIRRCSYRWWRVEIELKLRPADKLEAITFEYTLNT